MSYQRYKSPCPVIIWGHFGAENYILTQNRHVTGKSTNIKTITYTLKRESYTPIVFNSLVTYMLNLYSNTCSRSESICEILKALLRFTLRRSFF